jgi:hypothetical protein
MSTDILSNDQLSAWHIAENIDITNCHILTFWQYTYTSEIKSIDPLTFRQHKRSTIWWVGLLSLDNLLLDNLLLDTLSLDNLSLDNLSLDNLSLDNLLLDNLSLDNLSLDNLLLDNLLLDNLLFSKNMDITYVVRQLCIRPHVIRQKWRSTQNFWRPMFTK